MHILRNQNLVAEAIRVWNTRACGIIPWERSRIPLS